MSEYVAHAAVFDDVRHLALRHEALPPAFRQALRDHPDYGRAGSYTRGNYEYIVPLLTKYRDTWTAGDEAATQQLAWVTGWLAHRAADRFVKPMHAVVEADYYAPGGDGEGITKSRIWNDLVLYDETYRQGREGFLPEHLFSRHLHAYAAGQALDVRHLEDVVHAQWLAGLAALHGPVADEDAPFADRVDTFLKERQVYYVQLGRYADRVEDPDPLEVQRYVHASRFYDADDPLIVLVHGTEEAGAGLGLEAARARAREDGSQYARILGDALDYLDHAAAYWRREIDVETLKEGIAFTTWVRGPENMTRVRDILTDYTTETP